MSEIGKTTAGAGWLSLYFIGAAAAMLALAGTLFDIVLASIPGWEVSTVPTSIGQWYAQFQTRPLLALRNLDLLNIIVSVVGLPMYVALYGVHRNTRQGLAMLALLFVALGTAVFVTSNASLPMLELAQRYASATTEAQRLTLEGAGEALLARGAHGSAGAFPGFFLSTLGTVLMTVAMLRGGVFGRTAALTGMTGAVILLAYIVVSTFALVPISALLPIAGLGGILVMVWNVMVARGLFLAGKTR